MEFRGHEYSINIGQQCDNLYLRNADKRSNTQEIRCYNHSLGLQDRCVVSLFDRVLNEL